MLPRSCFFSSTRFLFTFALFLLALNGCQRFDLPPVGDSGGPMDDGGPFVDPDGGMPEADGGSPVTYACDAPFRSVTPDRCTAVWACAPEGDPSPRRDTFELQCTLIGSSWECTCYDRSSGVRVDEGSFPTSDGCGPMPVDTTDLARAYCGFAL